MTVPYTLANGAGNYPDANKFMANYSFLESLIGGNLLGDPGFEDWNLGTSFAGIATGVGVNNFWAFEKAGVTPPTVTIAREGTTKDTGTYSMSLQITGAGSGDSYGRVYQNIKNAAKIASQTIIFGAKVYASTSNKVRLAIYDGTTTTYSSYHSGTPGFETLSVQYSLGSAVTSVKVWVEVNPADFTGTIYFDSSYLYIVPSGINSAAVSQLSFASRIMRHLLRLDTYVGDLDNTEYIFGDLYGGGGSAGIRIKTQTTTSIAAVAKQIITVSNYGGFAIICGDNSTAFFMDVMGLSYGGSPQDIIRLSMSGAPAARTYSNAGSGVNKLVMAAGTYDVQVLCFDMSGR